MRKLIVLLVMICASGFVFGQNLQYGIKTGLSFASQSIDDPNIISKNSVSTYFITGYVEKPLKHSFYFEAGLGIAGKGVTTFDNSQTSTYQLTYLDIPLDLLYKFSIPALGKLYVGAGPYISAGLSGNVQYENTNNSTGLAIEYGKDNDYKRIDAGANFAAGFELNNHLTFNTNYSLGLNNIAPDNPNDGINSIKNRVFSIGLGLFF